MIGTKLAHYEITSHLGAGGMGEVYQAIDSKLGRSVAIKLLPEAFTHDADRAARFEREARVLASLNHPNIAAIYGIEESGGRKFLVMELVGGETLGERIKRGAVPIEEALSIAKEIAEGLEGAHEKGIIHRDLKPANVKIALDGKVKILDFGLAKAYESDPANSNLSNSPTLSHAATQAGMILGTAAYMSPEQARGTTVDKRADLWSFGVMLCEMLTGTRFFEGGTVSDTLAAVLRAEPDWTTLPANTPAPIRRLLRRCLEKDRKRRLDSAAAARLDIEEALTAPPTAESGASQPATLPRPARSRALTWTLAASTLGLSIAVAMLWAPWRPAPSPRSTALRFTPFAFEQGGQTRAVWSPDGKAVAFGARQKETDPYQVYVRYLDSPVATPITHLAVSATPIDWTSTGRIVFASSQAPAGLWSVSPVGGEPEPLQASVNNPASVSRDGTALAWLRRGDDGVFGISISSPPGAAPKTYEPAPFATRTFFNSPTVKFSPDGKQILLIRNAGSGEEAWLMPYPANVAKPPHRILQGLPAFEGTPTFSWMPDNRHVVLSTTPGGAPQQLYMADTVTGEFAVFSSGTTAQRAPAVSPEGSKLVFLEAATDYDVVSVDLATAAVTPLITTQRSEAMPAWASRESALVYVTDRSGDPEIWLHKPGQADRPLVTARDFPGDTTQWFSGPILSPDATRLIYARRERDGPEQLWMSAVAGGSPVRLGKSTADLAAGSWSPDGNWFVYWNVQEGRTSLDKVKTTGQAEPEVLRADVKRQGSWVPVWSPSGDWILHSDGGVKLISPDGKMSRDLSSKTAVAYAFSADGQTIYGIRQVAAADRLELFSMSVIGGTEKMIGSLGREYLPVSPLSPALRLTLTPDRKSVTFSTRKSTSNLWLADGLNAVVLP
jgi:serine/threonine protein kinase/Tol biopolymer transport system component